MRPRALLRLTSLLMVALAPILSVAQEVAEAGKAVLIYRANPTAANKAAAEREVADLRVVRGR
jgi:hypothetical protein